jgi:hypothetical protein
LAHVTIEYMIMIPVLIMQIFLFPFTATIIMNAWTDSRITLQLQEITGHLGSSIQQLYYTMNRASISGGSLTIQLDIPLSIVDGANEYRYNITLQHASDLENPENHAQIMNLTLNFVNSKGEASTLITLGENAEWDNITVERSSISFINATKTLSAIQLSLEGGT